MNSVLGLWVVFEIMDDELQPAMAHTEAVRMSELRVARAPLEATALLSSR
jgi:hypothetical protein